MGKRVMLFHGADSIDDLDANHSVGTLKRVIGPFHTIDIHKKHRVVCIGHHSKEIIEIEGEYLHYRGKYYADMTIIPGT